MREPIIDQNDSSLIARAVRPRGIWLTSSTAIAIIRPVEWLLRDMILVLILCVVAGNGYYKISEQINPVVFEHGTLNIWFESDLPRNFVDMNYHDSDFYTTHRHPLVPLIGFSPVYILKKVFGLSAVTAVRVTLAVVASLWLSGIFVVLRLMHCRPFDALLFTLLAMTSAAAIFWLVVPETRSFGSLTI